MTSKAFAAAPNARQDTASSSVPNSTPSTASSTVSSTATTFRPGFLPSLEGLRAVASMGIIGTHVAFQTGHDVGALWERILGRFDFFVAVFFVLSGFLLWRSHRSGYGGTPRRKALADADGGRNKSWAKYYKKRVARIMPAYWVLVLIVLIALPVGRGADLKIWLTNLTLTQVYFSGSLHGGLTHLWSLSVEVAFYIALPLFAIGLSRLDPHRQQGRRIVTISLLAILSFGWPYLPLPYPEGVNPHIQPIAYFSWFAAGMILAELESLQGVDTDAARARVVTMQRWARRRPLWLAIAVGALVLASYLGPEGLVELTNWEFTRRQLCGLVFGAAIIGPWTMAPESRFLEHPIMQALGRWSYGIFLWHVAMLSIAFPLLGVKLFTGHLLSVTIVTVALSIPVAAASYALVEEPARRFFARVWVNR
ncbi:MULTISPECIES: acyltransferase [unclassified Corynebacterium]|uniref:acyltransferase family protein n=1 Tax=unclassified Corynebacterium TaxID=2624378 RepID=UPI0008A52FDA|nr:MULTISPECIES: acyltransferase [unclassified Corynebacterium]OFL12870.1 integral membrane acyltransferase [Corynebacterium sp. HMSC063F04]OHR37592.1 integral membrane acyltransferase [Corynebacterium sp. HMSC075F02]